MSDFRNLKIKQSYDSDRDNIVDSFYVPTLSVAKKYSRLAGFFSSSSLYVAARGIANFIRNGGKMRIIVGANLKKSDVDAIIEAKEKPEEIIAKAALETLSDIQNELIYNHVRALGWMVAKNMLEIKVAILLDRNGNPMPYEEFAQPGIFHQKVGIMEDKNGDCISFSGSVNETASAWTENVEEFKVFRSWLAPENEYLQADIEKFEQYWSDHSHRVKILELPAAVKQKLIQMAPESIEGLNLGQRTIKKRKLREYQQQAIEKWFDNGKQGIFEMATGTGKTFTAMSCLERAMENEERMLIVISCPYIHLVNQWENEVSELGIPIIKAFGSTTTWVQKALGYILDINNRRMKSLIIITTHDTFSSSIFMNAISKSKVTVMLIADEMHGLGSQERQNGLIDRYNYRLGLSATPRRWLDEEGTEKIYDFFDKVIFEFSLRDAIEKINPDTGESYLAPYEYKPLFISLTEDEMENYKKQTKKIAKAYSESRQSSEKGATLWQLFSILRQRTVVNAEQKYAALEKILDELGEFSHCLIYCSPQQMQEAQKILNKRGIVQAKFTAEENAKERDDIITYFATGRYQALVAMKCLDEGVDIPPSRYAVLMANSGNPREFIQRRGRVLRRYPGKKKAVIYDVIVVPALNDSEPIYKELEIKIMKNEIKRYLEFATLALNSGEAVYKIAPYATKYGIVLRQEDVSPTG